MGRLVRMTILLGSIAFVAPPTALADTPQGLAKAAFAKISNPCADDETWIRPDRTVLTKDGGSINEYDKGDAVVRTPQPPKDFDPEVATDSALAEYGFPERPKEPEDLASWKHDMSAWRPTQDLGECETGVQATIIDGQRWSGYSADQAIDRELKHHLQR